MESTVTCHLVAMPFPGRGHINPMMNFCKLIASRNNNILITFVVTEEWLGYIRSEPKPDSIRFATVSNVIPSESLKAVDFPGFYEAVMTKMEAPFVKLLDQIEPPVTAIIGDVEVRWAIGVGNQMGIPVAALWTMSATFFSILHHFELFRQNQISSIVSVDAGNIPGISPPHVSSLRTISSRNDSRVLQLALECISEVPKTQYLLFTSVNELEGQVMDTLKKTFRFPVYPIGPAIPYLELHTSTCNLSKPDYLQWLDSQLKDSVLYISLGSFLSVSTAQLDEIVSGLRQSDVRFLWVARGEASRLKEICSDIGLVVPWCDQLKVLSHPSIGGFWTHCGWNSTLEAVFSGIPMLTFPLFLDQDLNSFQIVEDWRIGWEVKRERDAEPLVRKEVIAEIVEKFMDFENNEVREMRHRAEEFKGICQKAVSEVESSVSGTSNSFMESVFSESTSACHIAVIPYPRRGHINPLLNFCKLLVTENDNITATFIVTEEWLGLLGSDPKPDKIKFCSIPNVIPLEKDSAKNMAEFTEAVWKMMEFPCEKVLDHLELPASLILADFMLHWAVRVGNRKKIPVALFWSMSAMVFSVYQNYDLLGHKGHFLLESSDRDQERLEYLPGLSSLHRADLARVFKGSNQLIANQMRDAFTQPKAQYLLLSTIYELEPKTIHDLKQKMSIPIYTIGPAIPYPHPENNLSNTTSFSSDIYYIKWLDRQPCRTVLYVSMGSYVSVSTAQMEEIAAGLRASGVRFLWVARSQTERLKELCGDNGLVVPWCDQLRVLCHSSIAGFWTHCRWNSVREGILSGVNFLTFPLEYDQFLNSRMVVEDWKVGWRVKEELREEYLVKRVEIDRVVKEFMNFESNERKEMQKRVNQLQEMCQSAGSKYGSSKANISSFIRGISSSCQHYFN